MHGVYLSETGSFPIGEDKFGVWGFQKQEWWEKGEFSGFLFANCLYLKVDDELDCCQFLSAHFTGETYDISKLKALTKGETHYEVTFGIMAWIWSDIWAALSSPVTLMCFVLNEA